MKRTIREIGTMGFLAIWIGMAWTLSGRAAAHPASVEARTYFAALAAELPFLDLGTVLYDRTDRRLHDQRRQPVDPEIAERHHDVIAKVTSGRYPKEVLLELVGDPDSSVRALAAVALFDLEDPSVLPALAGLFDDDAEIWGDMCVNTIASAMINFYTSQVGVHRGSLRPGFPDFGRYWKVREFRSHCASWFGVQLLRACRGSSEVSADVTSRVQAVRARVDLLPVDDRAWTLLSLRYELGSEILVSEEDLVKACRDLGRSKLIRMLTGVTFSDDPDLLGRFGRISDFILQNATVLLPGVESGTILAAERFQNDVRPNLRSPWWAIAAARLNPSAAPEILHDALDRFTSDRDYWLRAQLYIALWQLGGNPEMKFIIDRLYGENCHDAIPTCRSKFITAMGGNPTGKDVLTGLLHDSRLDRLFVDEHRDLVRAVNEWFETPLVTEDELRNLTHPDPMGYLRNYEEALKRFPAQTAALSARLAEFRRRMRDAVP